MRVTAPSLKCAILYITYHAIFTPYFTIFYVLSLELSDHHPHKNLWRLTLLSIPSFFLKNPDTTMNQNSHEPNPSPTRRKLLTGLVAASAVSAMAPQQWTQPVLKRMITPAHGQALSVAAGRYTARLLDDFGDGCSELYSVVFDWPGGSGETLVEVTSTFIQFEEVDR
jgi:hypothetical protein